MRAELPLRSRSVGKMTSLQVTYSNRLEALIACMAERLPSDPLAPTTIVVPSAAVERFVALELVRWRGVTMNVRFVRLESWLERTLDVPLLNRAEFEDRYLALACDPALERESSDGPLGAFVEYVRSSGVPWNARASARRRLEWARRLARLHAEYALTRPDWIRAWNEGRPVETPLAEAEAVQRAWYRRARELAERGAENVKRTVVEALGALSDASAVVEDGSPTFVVGGSYLAPSFVAALVALGARRNIHALVLNPCREFWADSTRTDVDEGVESQREDESRLLVTLGRAGREFIAQLDEATDYAGQGAFVDPVCAAGFEGEEQAPLIARIQRALLDRRPPATGPKDPSVALVACANPRRETETAVQLVWGLVAEAARKAREGLGDPLLLRDVAIVFPEASRERYLPHLEAVLGDGGKSWHLPWSSQELSLVARSPVAEAVRRLIAFFDVPVTRRSVLELVLHPRVRASVGAGARVFEHEWTSMLERAGVVRGIDERDLAGTYAARMEHGEHEVLHFEQGLERIAASLALGRVPEADVVTAREESALGLMRLVRSLLLDHRAIGGAELEGDAWGELLAAMAEGYVRPEDASERAELEQCRKALRKLGGLGVLAKRARMDAGTALALAERALGDLSARHGDIDSGIVVGSISALRGVPFRVIVALGMGEGEFPRVEADGGLDLRQGARRTGDVSVEDRDRFAFLEMLLSAREQLVLTYTACDERTGDRLAPSVLVTSLQREVGDLATFRPPRARYDAIDLAWLGDWLAHPETRAVMVASRPADVDERLARMRGDQERSHFLHVEVEREAWTRLAPDDPRRGELALVATVPPQTPATTVRLSALHRFLRCPLQGLAVQHLGSGFEDESALRVEEEPLEASAWKVDSWARQAVDRVLAEGIGDRPLEQVRDACADVLRQAQRRAEAPVGVLGVRLAEQALERAQAWLRALEAVRPAVRCARPIRFGRAGVASEPDRSEPRAALELPNVSGDPALPPVITIEGVTVRFRRDGGEGIPGDIVEFLVLGRKGGQTAKALQLDVGTAALRAFVDHALLAASEAGGALARRMVLVSNPEPREVVLPPLARDVAIRWLRALSEDLLGIGRYASPVFLPIEALLREWASLSEWARSVEARDRDRDDTWLRRRLLDAIERVRGEGGGSSARGPLRDAARYEAPGPAELLDLVERRYQPFFASVGMPAGVELSFEGRSSP